MEKTSYQRPEIRDSNDNIIQTGAYGKNSAFCNSQNTGILDYINNNLEALNEGRGNLIQKTGDTLSGVLSFSTDVALKRNVDNDKLLLYGATNYDKGAYAILNGQEATTNSGAFQLTAKNSISSQSLVGKPDGTLTWSGNDIATTTFAKKQFVIERITLAKTISPSSNDYIVINTYKEGYNAVGMVAFRTSNGSSQNNLNYWGCWFNDNGNTNETLIVAVKNLVSSNVTVTFVASILYQAK